MFPAPAFARNGEVSSQAMDFSYSRLARSLGTKRALRTVRHHCKSVFLTEVEWYNPRTPSPPGP
ncbi:MAG TPA: hypothetical protein DEB06_07680, partial [Phycisphaerales bacterium]|nr:hypothetical protein [Phycisphaerales bacterium]